MAAAGLLAAGGAALFLALTVDAPLPTRAAPDPNQPIGVAQGVHPGRVAWVWDHNATDWSGPGSGELWYEHMDQPVVANMLSQALRSLAGETTDAAAWDSIFRHFNQTHGKGDVGYQPGEKIAIKINNTLTYSASAADMEKASQHIDDVDNSPQLAIALLDQLIGVVGAAPGDISVGDPSRIMPNYWYDILHGTSGLEDVVYMTRDGFAGCGRTLEEWSDVPFYWSDPDPAHFVGVVEQDYIPLSLAQAHYVINCPIMKSHYMFGVTLCGKNHFGALLRNPDANEMPNPSEWYNMHLSQLSQAPGMGNYRCLVDLLGHPDLGGKALLHLVDALFAGQDWSGEATIWNMAPFSGDWPNSILLSQDPVALDSVCYDFMYNEWTDYVRIDGADDYLHEAALADNPPSGAFYDPDGDAVALSSLGTHEHWNNATDREYSRNLGTGDGVELVATMLDLAGQASAPSPADGATGTARTALLSWTAGASAESHDVYFGTDPAAVAAADHSSPEFMGTQAATTFDPGLLSSDVTYYWAVDEVAGPHTWPGAVWSFTTTNCPPSSPTSPSPPHGATYQPLDTVLAWATCSDPDGDPVTYDVYIGRDSLPGSPTASGLSSPGYDPGTLDGHALYRWQVVASDDQGGTTWGPEWTSTTRAAATNTIIVQTDTAPAIDGVAETVWSAADTHPIANLIGGTVSGPDDLSATWQALWDSASLYVLVDVADDVIENDSANAWEDDSVELYLDADNSKGTSYDGINDYQLVFRWNDGQIHVGSSSATDTTGITFGMTATANGYACEVLVPWTTLGVTPAAESLLGIDAHVNDDDDGDARDGKLAWFTTDDMSWSDPSLFGTAELIVPSGDSTAPDPPTGLVATAGDSQVALDWNDNTEPDLSGYRAYRSTTSGSGYSQVASPAGSVYTDTGLANGTTYYYVVTAYDTSANESAYSNEASATPAGDTTPPAAPANLTAGAGDAQVSLDWDDNAEPDLSGYRVYRSTTSGSGYSQVASPAGSAYADTGLANGTTYYYVVTACDTSANESAYSNEASATPQAGGYDATIAHASSAPSIDGAVDGVWATANSYSIANPLTGSTGGSDLSGTWRALWDSSSLYHLVEVTDESLQNDSTNVWDDDSVEVYVDADNSKGTSYDGVNDFQYIFRWNDGTIHLGANSATNTAGIAFDIVAVSGGYVCEVSIPWTTLGVTPAQGSLIGTDVHVNDDDDGTARDGKIAWFATTDDSWSNPTLFATADLGSIVGNDPPTAVDDSYSTDEDQTLNVSAPGVLANDSDPNSDPLTAILVSDASNGTLTLNANGSFDYTPDADYNGGDSFTYKANDGLADSNVATVSITVNPVNDPPVAVNDSYGTQKDVPLNVSPPGVLGNDSDAEGNPLSAVLVADVSNGTLTLNANGSFDYTPDPGYSGGDSFTYKANDGLADSNVATVSVTVSSVNDPPTAVNDSYSTDEDQTLNVSAPGVLANDSDPNSDPLTAILVSDVSNGALTLNADGSFTYTPDADYNGDDSFTYKANDGLADSSVATVSITVNPVNDAPVAVDDSYSTDEDVTLNVSAPGVLGNDSDVESDPLTAVLVADVSDGTLTLNADGSFDYTPDPGYSGDDSFTYKANDGLADSGTATVTITVTPGGGGTVTLYSVADSQNYQGSVNVCDEYYVFYSYWDPAQFKFDLAGVTGSVTNATLRLYSMDESASAIVNVYDAASDNWTECGSVTSSGGNLLDSASVTGVGWYEFDVTGFVASEAAGDGVASFWVPSDSNTWYRLGSREGTYVPELVVTTSGGGDVTPPAAPAGLSATAGDAQVSLDWDDNTEGDLDGYKAYRSTTSGSGYAQVADVSSSAHTDTGLTNGTTYYYVVTAYDTSANESDYSAEVSATPQAGTGLGFLQDSGADGIVCFEAESYDDNVSQGGKTWTIVTSPTGYSGSSALRALPNTEVNNNTGYVDNSPRLDFQVLFVKTGTHYVWVRGYGPTTGDDSCHAGVDGAANTTADRINGFTPSYEWHKDTMDGVDATVDVPDTGMHPVNIWMREDGFIVDKVLLTTSVTYTPTGMGPPESPRSGDTTPPAAPTGLTATGGDGQVSLDWNDNAEPDLSGYRVYRSTTSGSGYSQTDSPSSSACTDSGVTNGTTYYYVVTAVDTSSNESGYSNEANATPQGDTTPPAAPTGLTATGGDGQVSLDWNDNAEPDLSGYRVYRSTTSGSGYSQIASPGSSAHADSGVTNGTTYYYVVTAVDTSSNESSYSNEASATPQGPAQSPYGGVPWPIPGTIQAEDYDVGGEGVAYHDTSTGNDGGAYRADDVDLEVTGDSAGGAYNVGWTATGEWLEYTVDVAGGTYDIEARVASATTPTGSLSLSLDGQPLGTIDVPYTGDWQSFVTVALTAVPLGAGAGQVLRIDLTGTVNVNWLEFVPSGDTTPPAAPTGLSATVGDAQVSLDWNDNTEPDLSGYRVYRSTTSGSGYSQIASPSSSAYTDPGVTNGTTYYYVVTAVDTSSNESGYSNEASATPADTTPPVAPTALSATAGDGQVSLDWNDNSEPDLDGYRVYRSTTSGSGYSQIAGPSSSAYTDSGVTNGTTYYYVVTAVDTSSNESGYSNEASATPQGDTTPPAAPTGLSATPGDGHVDLDWNDNGEGDLASYRVYRSTTSGSGYSQIAGPSSSAYTDSGVANGTTYYYVVTAVDTSSNESGYSNEASATPADTTPPAAPTGLSATPGDGQVDLDWNDNGEGDLANYRVYRSTTSGSGYSQIAGPSSSAYTDPGVTNGTTYYYVVTAVDTSSNESGYSNEAGATPQTGGGGTTTYNFVGVTQSTAGYNAYACDVDVFPFGGSSSNRNSQVEATDTQYVAISADNQAEWASADPGSRDEVFLWLEMRIDEPVASITQIDLTFSGNTDGNPATEHSIYVMAAGADWRESSSWTQVGASQSIPPDVDTTVTRSITSGFSSYVDGSGNIVWGVYEARSSDDMRINYVEVAVHSGGGDTTPPGPPTGLSATAGNGQVTLDWSDNTEPDLSGYGVYRSTTSGSGYSQIAQPSSSQHTDDGVANGTTYYYVVTAVDTSSNESGYSNEASATPAGSTADATIPSTATAPVIDGTLDAVWAAAGTHTVGNVVLGSVSSDSDLSGTWRALWDATNLYVYVSVTDDTDVRDDAEPWEDDSVEVYIDADNSKGAAYDGVNDYQYGFERTDPTVYTGYYSASNTAGIQFAMPTQAGGYVLEVAIPWATLGTVVSAGSPIGLDVHINDDDNGGSREAKRAWFATEDMSWSDPSLFATAELVAD